MLWSVVHEDVWLRPGRHAGFLHSIGLPGMLDSIVASKVRIVKRSRVSFLVDWANAVKFSFRRRIHMGHDCYIACAAWILLRASCAILGFQGFVCLLK